MEVTAWHGSTIAGTRHEGQRLGPVDTVRLNGITRERVEALIYEVGFFDLPDELPTSENVQQTNPNWHWVEVVAGNQKRRVSWNDNSEAPEALHRIFALLTKAGARWTSCS
jgi:hypothetical protein